MVVEVHHRLGSAADVGHDEPDARKQLALMPLDLCHDAARSVPRLRLVLEAVVEPLGLHRRSAHRARQQVVDLVLQDGIGLEPDGVSVALGFEQFVQLGGGESRVATKEPAYVEVAVACNDGFEN